MKKLLALVIAAALCAGLCGCASTVSVSGAQIDADGHLILSMSDGSTLDAGLARGEKGEKGDRGYDGGSGTNGKTPYIGENGNWWIDGKDTGVYAGNKVDPEPDNTCLVTIKYWDYGNNSVSYSIKKGQSFKSIRDKMFTPDTPSGFCFTGWYVGNTPFDIDAPINEDITVEAKYAAAAYADNNGFIFLDEGHTKLVACKNADGNITIPDTTVEIAARAFAENCFIGKLTIQSGIKVIGENAFANCNGLKTVILPDGLKEIGENAFLGCNLTSIVIPDSVTALGIGAFYGTSLTYVTIGKGITALPDSVFRGCSKLETVTIGSNITSIGDQAFYGCSKLKTVVCEAEILPTLGGYILSGAPDLKIKVPAGAVEAYKAAPIWSTYAPYIMANS